MNNTMIQISKDTRQYLKDVKITKRETYDEIILRLLKQYDGKEN